MRSRLWRWFQVCKSNRSEDKFLYLYKVWRVLENNLPIKLRSAVDLVSAPPAPPFPTLHQPSRI